MLLYILTKTPNWKSTDNSTRINNPKTPVTQTNVLLQNMLEYKVNQRHSYLGLQNEHLKTKM